VVSTRSNSGDSERHAGRDLHAAAVAPFLADAARLRPQEGEAIDAHTHLGLDEDGRSLSLEELLLQLDEADVARACTFPLHDPERRPAYRVPNDRVLSWAGESGARLVPFCRLDPFEDPLKEGERSLAAGARGIKLHPRAQSFTFDGHGLEDALEGIFALADEARVPILIHAGRGLPPIADGLVALAMRHPDVVLILAHGAICDQGVLTCGLADHPGVLYDTSCFFPVDVLELFARVPAERVVFGSDPPYGRPLAGLYLALRVAHQVGLDEVATRAVLGETMASLLDGRGLPPARPPRGAPALTIAGPLARVYGYASTAGPALFARMPERAREGVEMALAAAREPEPGDAGEVLEVIRPALAAASELLADAENARLAVDLLYRVMTLSVTNRPPAQSSTPPPTRQSDAAPAPAG
jgi:predicted TIM-barrel fold metal-dependent hydrolase